MCDQKTIHSYEPSKMASEDVPVLEGDSQRSVSEQISLGYSLFAALAQFVPNSYVEPLPSIWTSGRAHFFTKCPNVDSEISQLGHDMFDNIQPLLESLYDRSTATYKYKHYGMRKSSKQYCVAITSIGVSKTGTPSPQHNLAVLCGPYLILLDIEMYINASRTAHNYLDFLRNVCHIVAPLDFEARTNQNIGACYVFTSIDELNRRISYNCTVQLMECIQNMTSTIMNVAKKGLICFHEMYHITKLSELGQRTVTLVRRTSITMSIGLGYKGSYEVGDVVDEGDVVDIINADRIQDSPE